MTEPGGRRVRALAPEELDGDTMHRLMHLACGYDGKHLDRVIHEELPALVTIVVADQAGGVGSRPIALAAYRAPLTPGDDVVLEYLATLEDHQGEGLASRLVDELRTRHPGSTVHAETDDDAIGFYRRRGFTTQPGPVDPRWPETPRYTCRLAP